MGTDPAAALERLRHAAIAGELDGLCGRHAVRLLVAFGSAARHEGEGRDLDLAIAFEPGVEADVVGLLGDLSEIVSTDRIDVMDLGRAGPVARERALVATVPLYESEPGAFALAQMAAMLERMETAWLRRLDLEAMSG